MFYQRPLIKRFRYEVIAGEQKWFKTSKHMKLFFIWAALHGTAGERSGIQVSISRSFSLFFDFRQNLDDRTVLQIKVLSCYS